MTVPKAEPDTYEADLIALELMRFRTSRLRFMYRPPVNVNRLETRTFTDGTIFSSCDPGSSKRCVTELSCRSLGPPSGSTARN